MYILVDWSKKKVFSGEQLFLNELEDMLFLSFEQFTKIFNQK